MNDDEEASLDEDDDLGEVISLLTIRLFEHDNDEYYVFGLQDMHRRSNTRDQSVKLDKQKH